MLRVLITNDDSIFAPGLTELARRLTQRCEVLVVAPAKPSSAKSQSITLHKPLRLVKADAFDCPCANLQGISAWACTGTPADCVMMGLHHLWCDAWPHIVISGINDGPNVAQDIAYSGTVGGAMEGAINGVPSIAVSLLGNERIGFDAAAGVVEQLVAQLFFNCAPPDTELISASSSTKEVWPNATAMELGKGNKYPEPQEMWSELAMPTPCFNVNIPDVSLENIRGIAWTRCGYRKYTEIVEYRSDPRGREYYWIAGKRVHEEDIPGTDTYALAHRCVSVTPLSYNQTSAIDIPALSAMMERS